MQILAVSTCFNRKDKTESCIKKLVSCNPNVTFTFVVVDDNSNDGTKEMLFEMKNEHNIHLINGAGNLYYSGGMRVGIEYIHKKINQCFDYLLMMNDDVEFFNHSVENMAKQSKEQENSVIVGSMCDENKKLTYGAIKYYKGIKYETFGICDWDQKADTFNANAVLIPWNEFVNVGIIDDCYRHSLGDFDYGLQLKEKGCTIYSSREYVGVCNKNSQKNTWSDISLGRLERIFKKESAKGAPTRQWFHFLKKNFGFFTAVKYSITPYIRIMLRK